MKKPNYGFQKQQKEMKRARKAEEKRLRKLNKGKEEIIEPVDGPIDHFKEQGGLP